MEVSKSDFIQWRDSFVTEQFKQAMIEEIEGKVSSLVRFAGDNPNQDKFNAGFIQGVQWLLDWEPHFIDEEGNSEDESESSRS